ncbi:MAG: D-alanyl-D-alanine carboxypeptidase [Candidatus Sungbacteria bacterium]|nr:D-alanyl-D-alanine carboxypeptidase [Candidatus Sungbacteria bacterium]
MISLENENRFSALAVVVTFVASLVASSMVLVAWERTTSRAGHAAVLPAAASRALPKVHADGITAEAFLVKTLSGEVLAERNTGVIYGVASLTKIMTGLLAREHGSDVDVWITPRVKEVVPKLSTVPVGDILPISSALALLLVESDNDIAEAIADSVGARIDARVPEPRDAFIRAMNKKAISLRMSSTHFDNPSGLDSGLQYSSAEDLFTLIQYVIGKYPDFWDVTANPPASVRNLSGGAHRVKSSSLLRDEEIVGVKTGLSENAKGALVLLYRTPYFPEDIAIIILRSNDRFGDGERLVAAIRRAFRGSLQ